MKNRILAALTLGLLLSACGQSREEELKEQHSKGAELVEDKAAMAKGLGDALQKDGKDAARSITQGVGGVMKGMAQGVDFVEADFKIQLSESAKSKQLKAERAVLQEKNADGQKGLKVYVLSEQAFNGKLQLRALDEKGNELGRSQKVEQTLAADDANYVDFRFDAATPLSRVAQFVIYSTQ
ncbi:hypothetical protein ACFQNF_20060 [Iodobacter arcticus]|uniref:Lipoprotein n=1 Tax=Iodobacter arcticus TaxID=590593 RepID=A0ABW2R372_9NEIS